MKQTRPGCQLVAPSASQWDGKAFVLGGVLCLTLGVLCVLLKRFCVLFWDRRSQYKNVQFTFKKNKISAKRLQIFFILSDLSTTEH